MSSTIIESFADLFNESLSIHKIQPGALVRATVVSVDEDWVTVNAGLKSEAIIPVHEFMNDAGEINISAGMEVDVVVEMLENGFGETLLSRERAKRVETWNELVVANERNESIIGVITGKVKGGFTVEIKNVRAFLPGSLVDVRPVRDLTHLEGKPLEFKVIKVDQKRNNIVVSRRAALETDNSSERAELLGALQEGQEIKGVVKNLTEYGAFIDLGGLDGLLHITDMSWKRVKHPSEIVTVGDEISVVILKFDRERNRVSLGLKQLAGDPWTEITRRYPIKSRLKGKVTNITDYGCFVEIDNGVEGLVHVSEMDWTNKNVHPSKIVAVGEEVEVMVLDIDEERRRISLGVKQCQSNPWGAFAEEHKKDEKISGKIKSITDFGIFIGLEGGIDGLVHLSDIAWNTVGDEALRQFKKGDEVHAVILSIDPERERISLGIKQLESDPFGEFTEELNKGSVVKGVVKTVEAKEAVLTLAEEVEGTLRSTEMLPKTDDLTSVLEVGQELELRISNLDRKSRLIQLTMKVIKETPAESANEKPVSAAAPMSTLGDLLKEQMGERSE